jgi:hypothetical protein
MATEREAFFECSFSGAHDHLTTLVRAWTADEAEDRFREILLEEGVREQGSIVVAPERLRRPAHGPAAS